MDGSRPSPQAPEVQPGGAAGLMLDLQGTVGNAGACRAAAALQRSPLNDLRSWGHDVAEGFGLESADEAGFARAELFHDGGPYGPMDVVPGGLFTGGGGRGGFEVSYDPAAGNMTAAMRVAVNFVHGLDDVTTPGSVIPADPTLAPLVTQATDPTVPLADRQALIQRYKWTADEQTTWKTDLEALIESRWGTTGHGHEFHVNKPQWEWIGAKLQVDLDVHDGPRAPKDHLEIRAIKFPPGENLYTRGTSSATNKGTSASPTDQTMTLASTDLTARPDTNPMRGQVLFGIDSDVLDATATGFLDRWIRTWEGVPTDTRSQAPFRITLEAHTSATGSDAHNMGLAKRRAASVSTYLSNNGFTNTVLRVTPDARGEEGARGGENADERRVDLIVGDGDPQILAHHEFGHAFGMGDEYATTAPLTPGGASGLFGGGTAAVGSTAAHDQAVQNQQTATSGAAPAGVVYGAIRETTEGVMSAGNLVLPQHVATFREALVEVTREEQWALGPPTGKPTPPGAGGTPTPTPAPGGP